ncbi:MAG TPA: amidohydrolase family protein [Mycobacteriales bacterium]|nr:amidohydrolase family protein [Mycobacteriales bacterium]
MHGNDIASAATEPAPSDLEIVSVDDHVLEPPDLWQRYLPSRFQDAAPRVVQERGRYAPGKINVWEQTDDGEWASIWRFEDYEMTINPGFAAAGHDQNTLGDNWVAMTYDGIREGCFEQKPRLADMDLAGIQASLCFPTFPRFCGQTFLQNGARDLSLACVQAYNDWMIDEWCDGDGHGRLIPLTLIPLWDAELAAAEIRRCADKGSHAMAFSENPTRLKLPSIHSGYWDPLFTACAETDTVVNMHIGSSSTFPFTSIDAPRAAILALTYQGSSHAFADWMTSGVLQRYPTLRVALSEGQVGWMPYLLERLDQVWNERPRYGNLNGLLERAPSEYMRDQMYGCVFDDVAGLKLRDEIGMTQIMFETDYPHGDSTWPRCREVLDKLVHGAGLSDHERYLLARGNAIRCYGLERFGITA